MEMSKCTRVDVTWNCFYLITMHISVYSNKVENEILLFPCDVISNEKCAHDTKMIKVRPICVTAFI